MNVCCDVCLYVPCYHSGYLRDVKVIDHISFTYTGRAHSFNWRRFGFKIHIPDHALPPGVNEYQLHIKASLSGQFQFPEDTEYVSGIYWIASPYTFEKPVTVEIQHCHKARASTAPIQFHIHCCEMYPGRTSLPV